jgi:hypothetical protein
MSAETIINVAKFAWDIIKDGKPAAAIDNSTANAVPQVEDWLSLTDTRGPNIYKNNYYVSYVWPFDDYVHAEFDILLKWQFGSRYKNGGAFIPNLWIEVPNCFVGYGWDAHIGITVQHPTNIGQPGAPVAALPVTIKGTVSSPLESYHVEWGYVVTGTGGISGG